LLISVIFRIELKYNFQISFAVWRDIPRIANETHDAEIETIPRR